MGSAENGGGQHPVPEGRKIGTLPPPPDVFDTFPNLSLAFPPTICVCKYFVLYLIVVNVWPLALVRPK